jgi:zinc protease
MRRAAVLLTLTGLVAAAPHADERNPLQIPYTEFTLNNGLHVVLHPDRSVPIVAVNVWYHVGSGHEKPGRTGFAHLFEHLMFEGSKHVPEGAFDTLLEAAGGDNNGSTTNDRTNYIIDVPSNALELALFLESDRMGFLLDTMTPGTVDGQRDVVKNERRQSYENAPYGRAYLALPALLFPKGHPYSWTTIGSMEDLSAASYEDVVEFFKTYYVPNNASLVIAGDIDIPQTKQLVEKWFESIPRGKSVPPLVVPPVQLDGVKREALTDKVQLPKLHLAWHAPARYAPGDAAMDLVATILTEGRSSRLYRRLVYELQVAQSVTAYQQSQTLGSVFNIEVVARPNESLEKIMGIVDEELDKLRSEPVAAGELARALTQIEAGFYRGLERVGGFGGKANQLNGYYTNTGMPDFFEEDLSRYRALSAVDLQSAVRNFLPRDRRVELTVMPESPQ